MQQNVCVSFRSNRRRNVQYVRENGQVEMMSDRSKQFTLRRLNTCSFEHQLMAAWLNASRRLPGTHSATLSFPRVHYLFAYFHLSPQALFEYARHFSVQSKQLGSQLPKLRKESTTKRSSDSTNNVMNNIDVYQCMLLLPTYLIVITIVQSTYYKEYKHLKFIQ